MINIKITIKKITDWDLVYREALYTQGKSPKKQFPSEEWKERTVKAQHSPLRCLQFIIDIEEVPNFVHNHLVRHVHLQPFIRTMREDLTGISSDKITRNTYNNGSYMINAQEFLNVTYLRSCFKASKETRETWDSVVEKMNKIEPILSKYAVKNCIRLGYCAEYSPCKYINSEDYKIKLDRDWETSFSCFF